MTKAEGYELIKQFRSEAEGDWTLGELMEAGRLALGYLAEKCQEAMCATEAIQEGKDPFPQAQEEYNEMTSFLASHCLLEVRLSWRERLSPAA